MPLTESRNEEHDGRLPNLSLPSLPCGAGRGRMTGRLKYTASSTAMGTACVRLPLSTTDAGLFALNQPPQNLNSETVSYAMPYDSSRKHLLMNSAVTYGDLLISTLERGFLWAS
jgi:hypothetical protein